MLVVSLRDVNLGKKPLNSAVKVSRKRRNIKKYVFNMYIFNSFYLLDSCNQSFL